MPNHFSALGFRVTSQEEFAVLLERAVRAGESLPGGRGAYLRWAPGAGVELWIQLNGQRAVVGCTPHFAGASRIEVGAVKMMPGEADTLDGGLYAWAAPEGDDPETGAYPFVVDLPDYDLVAGRLALPARLTLQVAAFAHELACYPDEAAYYASQAEGPAFAAESFIPSGLFVTEGRPPEAQASFAGQVVEAALPVNPVTGDPFHHLRVRTLGGEFDVVADPSVVEGAPVQGAVVHGQFWLSGRICTRLPPPERRGVLGRLFGRGR